MISSTKLNGHIIDLFANLKKIAVSPNFKLGAATSAAVIGVAALAAKSVPHNHPLSEVSIDSSKYISQPINPTEVSGKIATIFTPADTFGWNSDPKTPNRVDGDVDIRTIQKDGHGNFFFDTNNLPKGISHFIATADGSVKPVMSNSKEATTRIPSDYSLKTKFESTHNNYTTKSFVQDDQGNSVLVGRVKNSLNQSNGEDLILITENATSINLTSNLYQQFTAKKDQLTANNAGLIDKIKKNQFHLRVTMLSSVTNGDTKIITIGGSAYSSKIDTADAGFIFIVELNEDGTAVKNTKLIILPNVLGGNSGCQRGTSVMDINKDGCIVGTAISGEGADTGWKQAIVYIPEKNGSYKGYKIRDIVNSGRNAEDQSTWNFDGSVVKIDDRGKVAISNCDFYPYGTCGDRVELINSLPAPAITHSGSLLIVSLSRKAPAPAEPTKIALK